MAVKEPSRSASGMQAPSKRVAKELRVLRLLLWLSLIPCLNWNTVLAVEARTALFKTVPHDILEALRETDRARKSDKDAVVWMVDWVSGNSLPQMCLRDRWRNSNQQRNPPARVPRACAGSTGHTVSSYPTRLPERPWASAAAPTARGNCRTAKQRDGGTVRFRVSGKHSTRAHKVVHVLQTRMCFGDQCVLFCNRNRWDANMVRGQRYKTVIN